MGAGIAEVAAAAGHPVRIFDINPKAVDLAIEGITAKGSARFWPNGHHSSAGNR
ncbi:hypothetical protein C5706_29815, partial [Klebsiella pneumoniae]